MSTQLEEGFRAFDGTIHDVDDSKHEVVVEFPHEVMDTYRTDWAQHCFRDSFARKLPVMLWNHNPNELIGHATSAESLGARSRIVNQFSNFDDVPRARQAFAHIRDGDVPGFSFFFHNAQSIAHPSIKGGRRFTKADMLENSPVTFPSIPGAGAVSLRSEEPTLDIPTIEELVNLSKLGVLNDEGLRSAIAENYPNLREHITIKGPDPEPEEPDTPVVTALSDDATELAKSVDLCLGTALRDIGEFDTATLPDNIQQAIMHVEAGSRATAELLDIMGITPEVVEAVVATPTETSTDGNRSDEDRQADIDKALAKLGQRVA